jgi:hypothetical protein
MELETQQQQERKVVGHKEAMKSISQEELVEGYYYFNNRIPNNVMIKILAKKAKSVKIEVWNEYKSCFLQTTMSYDGFYRIVTIPVYE